MIGILTDSFAGHLMCETDGRLFVCGSAAVVVAVGDGTDGGFSVTPYAFLRHEGEQ
jgi:hypothetical protein